jgi:hypothetical protein
MDYVLNDSNLRVKKNVNGLEARFAILGKTIFSQVVEKRFRAG